jgi:hypothetical protein
MHRNTRDYPLRTADATATCRIKQFDAQRAPPQTAIALPEISALSARDKKWRAIVCAVPLANAFGVPSASEYVHAQRLSAEDSGRYSATEISIAEIADATAIGRHGGRPSDFVNLARIARFRCVGDELASSKPDKPAHPSEQWQFPRPT